MSFFFWKKDEPARYVILVDVESGSVAASWVKYVADKRPEILYTKRIPFKVQSVVDTDQMISALKRSLRELGTFLVPQAPAAPEKIIVMLSSPWYAAQVRSMHFAKTRPFVFSHKLATQMIERELELFEKGKMKEWKKFSSEHYTALEHITIETKLNGYKVNDPFGKKTINAELRAYFSMAPKFLIQLIEDALHTSFHTEVEFRTAPFALFSVLSHQYGIAQASILSIRGEASDGIIVRDGVMTDVFSLPVGTAGLLRPLMHAMGQNPTEMQSLLESHAANALGGAMSYTLKQSLDKAVKETKRHLHRAFESVVQHDSMPHMMYTSAQPVFLDIFTDMLASEEFREYASAGKLITTRVVDMKLLQGAVVVKDREIDISMILYTLFTERYL